MNLNIQILFLNSRNIFLLLRFSLSALKKGQLHDCHQ